MVSTRRFSIGTDNYNLIFADLMFAAASVLMKQQPEVDRTTQTDRSMPSDRVGLSIVCLSTLIVASVVLNSAPLQSANDRSRWCTVWSLVERGTYQIDEIDQSPNWSTIDKVRHTPAGEADAHFYSSKPPLLSTMVAGVYWLQRSTLGYDLQQHPKTVSRLILFVVNVVPWFFALLSLRKTLRLLNVSAATLWLMLIAAGCGSMLTPFLTTLNNHTPAATSLIFCLSAVIRLTKLDTKHSLDFAIVGLTAALTVCFELPAALFGLLSFFLVCSIDLKKTIKFYVPAALVPLAAFFITNWICTGGIKPFYAYYGTEKYVYVHEGIPSYWTSPQGIDANTESTPVYLFHCVLGHHGLLSLTPFFVLTIWGWFCLKAVLPAQRAVHWMGAFLSVAVLVFYLSRTQNYNYGGNTAALRWMLWLTPFWWYGALPALQKLTQKKSGIIIASLLLGASVFSASYSIATPWKPGWVFQSMHAAGWIDYRTKIDPFDPPRYSILANIQPGQKGVWKNNSPDGQSVLEIETTDERSLNGQAFIITTIKLTTPSASGQRTFAVDIEQFNLGSDVPAWLMPLPAEWHQELTGTPLPNSHRKIPNWAINILRSLPRPRTYNAESPRFLKYTRADGEKWAIKCDRGASRVRFIGADKKIYWQRSDVMYAGELPFGLAAWTTAVYDEESNTLQKRQKWVTATVPD